jgi:hypothetical protein
MAIEQGEPQAPGPEAIPAEKPSGKYYDVEDPSRGLRRHAAEPPRPVLPKASTTRTWAPRARERDPLQASLTGVHDAVAHAESPDCMAPGPIAWPPAEESRACQPRTCAQAAGVPASRGACWVATAACTRATCLQGVPMDGGGTMYRSAWGAFVHRRGCSTQPAPDDPRKPAPPTLARRGGPLHACSPRACSPCGHTRAHPAWHPAQAPDPGRGIVLQYEGEFFKGGRQGLGSCFYPNGEKYTGAWRGSTRHGHGRHEYANGDVYEGAWHADARHGAGCLWSGSGGGSVFVGQFVADQRQGLGTLYLAQRGAPSMKPGGP